MGQLRENNAPNCVRVFLGHFKPNVGQSIKDKVCGNHIYICKIKNSELIFCLFDRGSAYNLPRQTRR